MPKWAQDDNGSNNSLFLSCQTGLSDGTFFMIKHTPIAQWKSPHFDPYLPNGSSRYVGAIKPGAVRCGFFNHPIHIFSNFSCMFLNPNNFFNMNSNCSNLLDLRNKQEQVKKAFCYQQLFWSFIVWINCSRDLKNFANSRPSVSYFKHFSRSQQQFFLTVGQNNFGNKITFLLSRKKIYIFCLRQSFGTSNASLKDLGC